MTATRDEKEAAVLLQQAAIKFEAAEFSAALDSSVCSREET